MKKLSKFIAGCLAFSGTVLAEVEPSFGVALVDDLDEDYLPTPSVDFSDSYTTRPVVRKFANNIYNQEYWSNSVYHDYLNAFWEGYNMSSYSYATTCQTNFNKFMDVFHKWYLTSTRMKTYTELWDLFFETAGTDANESWYNCFLFWYDLKGTYQTKWEAFNDFGDIYLSFIFNMLQNSLVIKSSTEDMIEAYDTHNTVTFMKALGSVLRSILDFDSYTSISGSLESESMKTSSQNEFRGISKTNQLKNWERRNETQERLNKA